MLEIFVRAESIGVLVWASSREAALTRRLRSIGRKRWRRVRASIQSPGAIEENRCGVGPRCSLRGGPTYRSHAVLLIVKGREPECRLALSFEAWEVKIGDTAP